MSTGPSSWRTSSVFSLPNRWSEITCWHLFYYITRWRRKAWVLSNCWVMSTMILARLFLDYCDLIVIVNGILYQFVDRHYLLLLVSSSVESGTPEMGCYLVGEHLWTAFPPRCVWLEMTAVRQNLTIWKRTNWRNFLNLFVDSVIRFIIDSTKVQ